MIKVSIIKDNDKKEFTVSMNVVLPYNEEKTIGELIDSSIEQIKKFETIDIELKDDRHKSKVIKG